MAITEIVSLDHPGVQIFSTLTEAQLRKEYEPGQGIFIAESPKVINVALNAGYKPVALLCERRHINGDAADIISRYGDIPVYTGERELLAALTGYTLTRGVLCAMERPKERSIEEICKNSDYRRRCRHHKHRSHFPQRGSFGHRCRTIDTQLV